MLQAKTKSGTHITLVSLTKTEITRIRKQSFFCPMCSEQVIVRAGPQTIPHFAHKPKSQCPYGEGGESTYHEKGKFLIYRWLKNQGLQARLEYYLPQVQQRPDIYLTISQKRIAIEYQCARIPIQTINKRIRGYVQTGITPIWILSAKLLKPKGRHRLKVDRFLRHFIHHFSESTVPVLYFFCPDTHQLSSFQHLYHTRQNQALGQIVISPLKKIMFSGLFVHQPYPKAMFYREWRYEKKYFRIHQKKPLPGKEFDWYRWLYEKGIHKEYLPSIIYIPVEGGHLMKTALWDWQSRIWMDIIQPLEIGDVFSYTKCSHLLRRFTDRSSHYPLIKPRVNPIKNYLNFLVQEGTLQEIGSHHFKKRRDIPFYTTLEKAVLGDERFIDKLEEKMN